MQNNIWYNKGVGSESEKKDQPLALRVPSSLLNKLNEISRLDDRPLGYVARELMVRGLSLYQHDGKLRDIDLKGERMVNGKSPPENSVPTEDLSYEDFMREIDLLNISHIEFLGDMRNASSTRRREVLDDIRRVIKGPIKSFTKPEDNEYPTLE